MFYHSPTENNPVAILHLNNGRHMVHPIPSGSALIQRSTVLDASPQERSELLVYGVYQLTSRLMTDLSVGWLDP